MTIRWLRRGSTALTLALAVTGSLVGACGDDDGEHSCNNTTHRCALPDKPYCDLTGEFPESMGVAGVCIPDPYRDAGVDSGP
jgi:hypothetical protein